MQIVEKPWGREVWIAHTDKYALKEITVNEGHRSSLQYHVKNHEHIYILKGKLQVEWENEAGEMEILVLGPGEVIENKPGRKHRVTALETTTMIEASTPELDDVVRVADDYQREN